MQHFPCSKAVNCLSKMQLWSWGIKSFLMRKLPRLETDISQVFCQSSRVLGMSDLTLRGRHGPVLTSGALEPNRLGSDCPSYHCVTLEKWHTFLSLECLLIRWKHKYKVALVVQNPPARAGDVRDEGLIPRSEDPLEEGMASHSSILAWGIPMDRRAWGGYRPWGRKELDT